MKIFTSYIVTERGAKVAPLPKFFLRFGAVLLICIGAFCLAGAAGDAMAAANRALPRVPRVCRLR